MHVNKKSYARDNSVLAMASFVQSPQPTRSITDIATAVIATATIFALIYIEKLQEPYIIGIAAILGLLIKSFL